MGLAWVFPRTQCQRQVREEDLARVAGGSSGSSGLKAGGGVLRRTVLVRTLFFLSCAGSCIDLSALRPLISGYALFFATFDASRRLALRVRRALEDHALSTSSATLARTATASAPRAAAWFGLESLGDDGEDDKEGGLGMRGTRLARTGQAIILILGGCLAGTLCVLPDPVPRLYTSSLTLIAPNSQSFALSSRPFDAVLHLLRSPHHLSPSASALPENRQIARGYILSHLRHPLHPGRRNPKYRTAALGTGPLPAIPVRRNILLPHVPRSSLTSGFGEQLIIKTYKARGPVYFFGPQAGGMHKIGSGGSVWRRVGFKLIGVAPWSLGFLAFAWAGGEL